MSAVGHVRAAVGALRGEGRGWVVVGVALAWFLVVGTMLTLPALLPRVIAEFEVTNARAGLAVTLLWLVYGALQFPAGLATDRLGERPLLLAGMVAGVVAVGAVLAGRSFPAVVVGCAALGVVGALVATPRVTVLTRLFPEDSGTAIGAVMALGNVGGAVVPVAAGAVAAAVGWRLGFGVTVPAFLAVFAVLWLVVPREGDGPRPAGEDAPIGEDAAAGEDAPDSDGEAAGKGDAADGDPDRSLRELARPLAAELATREVLLVTAGITLTFFTFQGLTAFLTTYLVTAKPVADGTATLLFGGLFATAAVAQPVAGRVADQVGGRVVLVVITALYAVLLVGLVAADSVVLIAALTVVLGTQRGATPVATAYLTTALSPELRGTGYGLLRTVFTGVASASGVVVGALADAARFDAAFLLLAGLAVVATGCYLLLPRGEAAG